MRKFSSFANENRHSFHTFGAPVLFPKSLWVGLSVPLMVRSHLRAGWHLADTQAGALQFSMFLSCVVSFSLCPVSSSHLDFLDPVFSLQFGKLLHCCLGTRKAGSWSDHRAHLIGFPILRDDYFLLSEIQCLRNCFIYFVWNFLVILCRRVNRILVNLILATAGSF